MGRSRYFRTSTMMKENQLLVYDFENPAINTFVVMYWMSKHEYALFAIADSRDVFAGSAAVTPENRIKAERAGGKKRDQDIAYELER